MRKDDRNPWVSIWMMAFSVGTFLLMLAFTNPGEGGPFLALLSRRATQVVLLAAIFMIGLVRMPPSPYDGKKLSLTAIANIYAEAWRQLCRHKWILWVFGAVALVSLVGRLAETPLTATFSVQRMQQLAQQGVSVERIYTDAERALSGVPLMAFKRWLPGVESSARVFGFLAHSLVFFVGSFWLLRRLSRLRLEPGRGSGAKWLEYGLIPAAIVFLGLALAMTTGFITSWLAAIHTHGTGPLMTAGPRFPGMKISPQNLGIFGGKRLSTASGILGVGNVGIYSLILSGLLIAGLAGSLKRLKRGEPVAADSFVEDIACFFKPVTAAYLLIAGIEIINLSTIWFRIPFLTESLQNRYLPLGEICVLSMPLFMLVPYAAVMRNVGAWQGIKTGLRDFFANGWASFTFVALGLTFVSVPLLVLDILARFVRYWYGIPQSMLLSVISAAVMGLTTAFVSVAIWEYYWRIAGGQDNKATSEG